MYPISKIDEISEWDTIPYWSLYFRKWFYWSPWFYWDISQKPHGFIPSWAIFSIFFSEALESGEHPLGLAAPQFLGFSTAMLNNQRISIHVYTVYYIVFICSPLSIIVILFIYMFIFFPAFFLWGHNFYILYDYTYTYFGKYPRCQPLMFFCNCHSTVGE